MTEPATEITIAVMATRIRKGARTHLYITQWRELAGLSVESLAARIDVDRTTMWRYETNNRKVTPGRQAQIAAALSIEPADLWRRPDARPSLDQLARNIPDDSFAALADYVKRLAGSKG